MNDNIITVTDDNFESAVLRNETPVLIDYWAESCGPCKLIIPVLEEIADDYAGKLVVAKLDVGHNPKTPAKYGVRGTPTLMIFKGGELMATIIGALPKSKMVDFIQTYS